MVFIEKTNAKFWLGWLMCMVSMQWFYFVAAAPGVQPFQAMFCGGLMGLGCWVCFWAGKEVGK